MGTFKIPQKFADADRWLGIFPTQSFIFFIVGIVGTLGLGKLFALLNIGWLGLVIGFLITATFCALSMITIPIFNYKKGGGVTLLTIVYRVIKNSFRKRVYSKCSKINNEADMFDLVERIIFAIKNIF